MFLSGLGALYKGVVPTMLRQGCNQAVNFTAYQYIKARVMDYQGTVALLPWQSLLIGGFSGGMGPLVNNPLGTCYAEHVYCCLLLKIHSRFNLLSFRQ